MKKKLLITIVGVLVIALTSVALYFLIFNKPLTIKFNDKMIKTTVVDQICDLSKFVDMPEDATVSMQALYTQDGKEQKYLTAGLTFKPLYVGDVNVIVSIEGSKSTAKATIKVIESKPTIVTISEANYDKGTTIKLSDLLTQITYVSKSTPELVVKMVEFETSKIDLTGKSEYTFEKIGVYAFSFELKNMGGGVAGIIKVKITRALTANEKNDLTNMSFVGLDSHVTLEMSDEHSVNSDWSWKMKAFPGDFFAEGSINYYMNHVWIKFDKEIDVSKQYFTMDLKATKDSAGIGIHYLTSANTISPDPMGFQDVLGEWTEVSSEGKYNKGIYQGIYIMILHNKNPGTYDVNNVSALIDNLQIHNYQDPNSPILVGGVSSSVITDNTISLTSRTINDVNKSSYAAINGEYTNQTFEFTTTIKNPKSPNLMIGARMDKVGVILNQCKGVSIRFYNDFFEVYSPLYGTTIGAGNVTFDANTKYVFKYGVDTQKGKSTLYLNIKDMSGNAILDYILPITTPIPASGLFAIWNMDLNRSIDYKKPYIVERKQTINKVVTADQQAGKATIVAATPNNINSAAYLALKGSYTNEHFEFKTTIKNASAPNIVIGARMAGYDVNPDKYNGVVIRLYKGFLEIYAPKYGLIAGAEAILLKSNTEYTFVIDVITENNKTLVNFIIKEGNTIVLNLSKPITAKIPASGSFVVWSLDESTDISYNIPKTIVLPVNINKVIDNVIETGTATIGTVEINKVEKAAYLALRGAYTNEHFEFTTTIKDDTTPNLLIGARMQGFDANPDKYNGVVIRLYNGFLEIYAPKYGALIGAEAVTLEKNTKYTFGIDVITENNISTLNFTIKKLDVVVLSLAKVINGSIPDSGSFVVWTMDEKTDIMYQVPKSIVIPTNENKIVMPTEQSGITTISAIEPGKVEKASYLAMQGAYTNEKFEFKTTIKDAASPNLVIGARMAGFDSNPDKYDGVVIRLYDGFLEVYAPKYGLWAGAVALTLTSDTEYTFGIDVTSNGNLNTLNFVVSQENTILLNYTKSIDGVIPASGAFVVWSMDAITSIAYEMPKLVIPPANVNKIVTSADANGIASISTIVQNSVEASAFLQMQGAYTNENFEFVTTIKDGTAPNLVIGARMVGVESNPDKNNGITIRFYNGFFEVYAPKYGWWADAYGVTLASNTEYSFKFGVTSLNGTNTLSILIMQGTNTIINYSKVIGAEIPASGSFAVWSMDESREISYKKPY